MQRRTCLDNQRCRGGALAELLNCRCRGAEMQMCRGGGVMVRCICLDVQRYGVIEL
jgi:hypothetical protein